MCNAVKGPVESATSVVKGIPKQFDVVIDSIDDNDVDVDVKTARAWLHENDCKLLIHGHTHRPATHDLGDGLSRMVLSDWEALATPPRLEVLRWTQDTQLFARISLNP